MFGKTKADIKLGVIQSLTGIAQEDGTNILKALELAVDEINAKGDTQIKLLVEDDATNAKSTVSAYQKLKSQRVDAIFGPSWVHTVRSITPLVGKDKIVAFNSSNFPETMLFEEGQGYIFTNMYSLEDDIKTLKGLCRVVTLSVLQ